MEKYNYFGITINQSLKLKDHEDRIHKIEKNVGLKVKLLGRALETTKGKRLVFKNMMKSRINYGIEASIKHDSKYRAKWESMMYRILKGIFGINSNTKKSMLLDLLCTNGRNESGIVDRLSPSAIKLKFGCLFNKYSKSKPCNWSVIKDNNYWITECSMTELWKSNWTQCVIWNV